MTLDEQISSWQGPSVLVATARTKVVPPGRETVAPTRRATCRWELVRRDKLRNW